MLAFRSLDPFRALREPDRRRRDEERLSRSEQRTLSKTQNNHLTGKAPYKFESAFLQRRVHSEPDFRGRSPPRPTRGFLNGLRPTGSWFFPRSARYERAATWRRGGGHRYVPCAINAVSVSQRRTRGCPASSQQDALPPRVGGFREAIAFGDGSSGGSRWYRRPAVLAVSAPNPMHDDRELARDRDFGASHANSFREPEAPALQD